MMVGFTNDFMGDFTRGRFLNALQIGVIKLIILGLKIFLSHFQISLIPLI
jgi:hypothetical protein